MDWTDRGTCVLFGDGAGAVVLEPREGQGTTADRGLLGFALRADGTKQDLLYVDGGPSTNGQVGKLRMQGNQVFRHAVVNISEAIDRRGRGRRHRRRRASTGSSPTRPTMRILQGVARRLGIDEAKVITTVDRARQHLGRLDPAGAGPGRPRRPHQAGPAAAAGGDGRRPHLGRLRRRSRL